MPTILGTVEYGGDGKAALLHLVNQTENLNLVLTDFEFQTPEIPTELSPVRNTKIKLVPKAGSGFYGVKTIWYNRIHVSELGTIEVPRGTATLVSELLPAINLKYGVLITPEDIIDATLPNVGSGVMLDIELIFNSNSVVFYGGTQIVIDTQGANTESAFILDTLLFGTDIVDYNFNTNQENTNLPIKLFEQWSLSVDKDFNRKTFCTNLPGNDLLNADQIALGKLSIGENQEFRNKFPFIFSWFNNDGRPRGLTPYGEVMELIDDGNIWVSISFIDTDKRNNTDIINGLSYLQDYGNSLVLNATKSTNGTLYVIYTPGVSVDGLKPLQRAIYKSTNNGNTWSLVNFTVTDAIYKNDTFPIKSYADFIARGNTLFLLSGNGDETITRNTIEYNLPIVEQLNLDNNVYTVKSIGNIVLKNTNTQIGVQSALNSNCLEFVNDENITSFPRVVVFGKTKTNNHPLLVMYDFSTLEPTGNIININSFNKEIHSVPGNFVQAYSLPLLNHSDTYLDVVEITHPVLTTETDVGFFYAFGEIAGGINNYTFGQKVFTSIRYDNTSKPWVETSLPLGKRYIPTKVKLIKPDGGVIKAISQGENALMTKTFVWNNTSESYTVSIRRSSNYDNSRAISSICKHGLTKTISYSVTEPFNNYVYDFSQPIVTLESSKDTIYLSFMARNINTQTNIWYTVKPSDNVLVQRGLSNEYKFFGNYPVATVSDGNNIYACLDSGTVIMSSNFGKGWKDYSSFAHIGKPVINNVTYAFSKYFGFTKEALTTQSFIKGGIVRDKICLQLSTNAVFELQSYKTNIGGVGLSNVSHSSPHGNVLEILAGKKTIYTNDPSVYNSLLPTSPYKINTWDLNGDNVVKIASKSEQNFNIGTNAWEFNNVEDSNFILHPDIEGEVIGIYTNLKYLDIQYGVLTRKQVGFNNEYHFYMMRIVDNEETLLTLPLPHLNTNIAQDTKRKIGYHLWDGIETYYVPFVIINHKSAYLIGRLETNGNFIFIPINIDIPNDNGSELVPLPMFNANRLEYYFVQQGNGVFKMYTPVTALASVMNDYSLMFGGQQVTVGFEPLVSNFPGSISIQLTLNKIVDITTLPSNILLQSGCETNRSEIYAPITPNLPGLLFPQSYTIDLNYVGEDSSNGGAISV